MKTKEVLLNEVNKRLKASFAGKIDMDIVDFKKGYGKAIFNVKEDLLNPMGTLHAGVLFTLADSLATTCCFLSYMSFVTTTNVHSSFLKSVKNEKREEISAIATALRLGNKIAVWEVRCYSNDDLIAVFIIEHLVMRDQKKEKEEQQPK